MFFSVILPKDYGKSQIYQVFSQATQGKVNISSGYLFRDIENPLLISFGPIQASRNFTLLK